MEQGARNRVLEQVAGLDAARFELAYLCAQEQLMILKGFLLGLKGVLDNYESNSNRIDTNLS